MNIISQLGMRERRCSDKDWYFKLAPKREEDEQVLLDTIREAGADIFSIRHVTVTQKIIDKRHRGKFAVCPHCGEAYPFADGAICLACQGEVMYVASENDGEGVLSGLQRLR